MNTIYDIPVKNANKLNLKVTSDVFSTPMYITNHTLKISIEIPINPKTINIVSRNFNSIE